MRIFFYNYYNECLDAWLLMLYQWMTNELVGKGDLATDNLEALAYTRLKKRILLKILSWEAPPTFKSDTRELIAVVIFLG